MKVRLLRSVNDGSEWKEPGTVCIFPDDDARRLIRLKAAEPMQIASNDSMDSGDDPQAVDAVDASDSEERSERVARLMEIGGVSSIIAERLYDSGFRSIQDVAEAQVADLVKIKGITKKNVATIQESAEDVLDK